MVRIGLAAAGGAADADQEVPHRLRGKGGGGLVGEFRQLRRRDAATSAASMRCRWDVIDVMLLTDVIDVMLLTDVIDVM